ncbi:hypothetical protein ColLi_12082 [Colletotrichum liriopes]|uniref:T6SS Phospholipase effector Tle1-like catalytic domain-containing protein n=1 Tax=Colletotrichum liriopes TaxID=708192 RepID=A0AA37LYF0_9PEZI|nr:hypothetical protein ColLi_12082 [Colletotrichum liriopes]
MWDCVNSVAVLEKNTPIPLSVKGTATHVRHAVAVDEFRVKFKPALLAQDMQISGSTYVRVKEDIEEVWFAGNHGDVGGGWLEADNLLDLNQKEHMSLWQRIVNFWTSRKSKGPSDDPLRFGFGLGFFNVLMWKVLVRWEL